MKQLNLQLLITITVFTLSSFKYKYDDGKTYKTAIKIDCTCKEYAILKRSGFRPIRQALQMNNNKVYDVFMNAKDELMIFELIKNETEQKPDTLKTNHHETII
jgi:hypothetical protein